MRTLLVDGDIFAFESACASQEDFEFGTWSDLEHAKKNFKARLESTMDVSRSDRYIICFSCPTRHYWRHDLWADYKGHRKTRTPPEQLTALKEFVASKFITRIVPNLEADDVMGILATGPWIRGETVVATKDKDLLQVPGLHINHSKLDAGVQEITEQQGDWWHLYQALVGDQCDGYKGCPGVGPKKAKKFLQGEDLWGNVVAVFESKGLTKEDALLQARLARILRASDWDSEKKEVRLWEPKTKEVGS